MEKEYEHVMFRQKIRPEKTQEYIKAHHEAWPELLKAIKESGIEREFVWVNDNTCYIYMMAKDFNKALSELANTEVFKKWSDKMDGLLAKMQDYSEGAQNVVTFDKVFDLETQLKELK